MKKYDIVVVGAGPAGSSAAKTAAEKGAKVIVLEEHPAIGIPRHCTGIFPDSSYSAEILGMVGEDIIIQRVRLTRILGPSGKIIQEIALDNVRSYAVRREEYDRAWARLAANAGAEIVLNIRVTALLKENGKIAGVITNSRDIPEVRGKLVIAAGGYHAMRTGITKQEGLSRPDDEFFNGVQLELTNVRELEPGVTEIAYGSMTSRRHIYIFPATENTCFVNFHSMAEFREVKMKSHPLCRKLRDAVPLRIMGYITPFSYGYCLPKTINDGLILVGSAAGFNGMIVAALTGRYAGEVAVEAIHEGNVTEAKLSRYEALWKGLGLDHEYDSWIEIMRTVRRLPDEALEDALEKMVQRGVQLTPRVIKLPF